MLVAVTMVDLPKRKIVTSIIDDGWLCPDRLHAAPPLALPTTPGGPRDAYERGPEAGQTHHEQLPQEDKRAFNRVASSHPKKMMLEYTV